MVKKILDMLNRTLTSVEFHTDPWAYKTIVDGELRIQNRDSKDPEQGPPPEPDDSYLFIASIAGIILGGGVGAVIAVILTGVRAIVIGLIAGCIAGGIIGAYVGSYLKKRKRTRRNHL
jgi:hypothetical protein